jgi:hypothetical protein
VGDCGGLGVGIEPGQVMAVQHIGWFGWCVVLAPLAIDVFKPHPERVVVFDHHV